MLTPWARAQWWDTGSADGFWASLGPLSRTIYL